MTTNEYLSQIERLDHTIANKLEEIKSKMHDSRGENVLVLVIKMLEDEMHETQDEMIRAVGRKIFKHAAVVCY